MPGALIRPRCANIKCNKPIMGIAVPAEADGLPCCSHRCGQTHSDEVFLQISEGKHGALTSNADPPVSTSQCQQS